MTIGRKGRCGLGDCRGHDRDLLVQAHRKRRDIFFYSAKVMYTAKPTKYNGIFHHKIQF